MTLDELINFHEKAWGNQTRCQIRAEVLVATVGETADLRTLTYTLIKECKVYFKLCFKLARTLRFSLKLKAWLDARMAPWIRLLVIVEIEIVANWRTSTARFILQAATPTQALRCCVEILGWDLAKVIFSGLFSALGREAAITCTAARCRAVSPPTIVVYTTVGVLWGITASTMRRVRFEGFGGEMTVVTFVVGGSTPSTVTRQHVAHRLTFHAKRCSVVRTNSMTSSVD
jgi:hypothetical protein